MDALSEVPGDLVEKYDVVHIRYLGPIVKRGNVEPIIQHAMQLLSKLPDYETHIQVPSYGIIASNLLNR